jgi:hypothetical protein
MPELADAHAKLALRHSDPGKLGFEFLARQPDKRRTADRLPGHDHQVGAFLDRQGALGHRRRTAFGQVERRGRH